MELGHDGTVPQWDWDTMEVGHNRTGARWSGTQWNWDTMEWQTTGLRLNGTGIGI